MALVFGLDPLSLVSGVFIFIFLWKITQSNGKNGLINKLPGPPALPLLGNIELLEPRHEVLSKMIDRQEKFGGLFRIWMGPTPLVIVGNPEHIEVVLKSSKHSEKSFTYKFLHSWLGTGLLTSHGTKWAMHRKLITPTFHFKILQSYVNVFHENANILVSKLKDKAKTGEEFDIYSLITLCTLDVICETAMGTKVNAQSQNQNPYVYSVYRLSALIVYRMNRIWLHPNFVFKLSEAGKEFEKHLQTVQGFTDKVIKLRKEAFLKRKQSLAETAAAEEEEDKKKFSFLDLLLETSMESGSSLLTDEEIREEVETFMFAGHDTTASGISWAISILGNHPKIQEDCYQEQKAIFENDPNRIPTLTDLTEMKLLERVIKETLRLCPSVTTIGRTLEENVQFGGYTIPKGITAVINIYGMHRNPKHYPDPHKFDPDRFLPKQIQKRHPYSYIPFSAGPRNCLGQKFALMEEKVILSALIRNYKFESLETTEKTTQIPDLVLRPSPGIKMKITKR